MSTPWHQHQRIAHRQHLLYRLPDCDSDSQSVYTFPTFRLAEEEVLDADARLRRRDADNKGGNVQQPVAGQALLFWAVTNLNKISKFCFWYAISLKPLLPCWTWQSLIAFFHVTQITPCCNGCSLYIFYISSKSFIFLFCSVWSWAMVRWGRPVFSSRTPQTSSLQSMFLR